MILGYSRWLRPLLLFLLSIFLGAIIATNQQFFILIVIVILGIITLFNLILETWVALAFISPSNNKPDFEAEGWVSKFHYLDSTIHSKSFFDGNVRPLVILIHGWRSGASSMKGRATAYIKMGFHVILFELPGHGKSESVSKWTAGHAATTFMQFYDNLTEEFDASLVSEVYLHGHSMGGFVLLRFSKNLTSNPSSLPIAGYVLESPMTCYSLIFEESLNTLNIPRIAEKIFWNRLARHFNYINPKIPDVTDISQVDVPKWGYIEGRCLVIQAEHDNRLGLDHFNQLIKSHQSDINCKLEYYLVDDLTHAGAHHNKNRDNIIESWLKSL